MVWNPTQGSHTLVQVIGAWQFVMKATVFELKKQNKSNYNPQTKAYAEETNHAQMHSRDWRLMQPTWVQIWSISYTGAQLLWNCKPIYFVLDYVVSYTRVYKTSAGCLRSIDPRLGMRQLFGDVTMGQWRHN